MKLLAVQLAVHVRVGEKDLGRGAFENDVEQVGPAQLVERLRGQDHGGVVLAPGLQCLDDVPLDGGVLRKTQASSMKKALKKWNDTRSWMTALAR